jgi:hypothetical protein
VTSNPDINPRTVDGDNLRLEGLGKGCTAARANVAESEAPKANKAGIVRMSVLLSFKAVWNSGTISFAGPES